MAGEWDKFVYGPTKKEDEPARVSSSWDDFVTPAPAPKSGITSNQIASSIDRYQAGLYGVGEAVAGAVGDSDDDATFMIRQRCPPDVATNGVAGLPDGMKRRKMFFYSWQARQLGAL